MKKELITKKSYLLNMLLKLLKKKNKIKTGKTKLKNDIHLYPFIQPNASGFIACKKFEKYLPS
jgi:hypothetical protein